MADEITFVVDGVEVQAREGAMLVDAAKHGDVEIPVFCYEPKLGPPVGACRMCLVEIEGIPKLQTACSTPARDGMVVYTQTDQVREAQSAVVEFLLVNHPLDCPVCDKGGECPLQDIAMGWGPGKSRVIDPKRHFQKPIPLSPLVKIDRERCILCYRCVRFSQDVSEDEQLQLLERGASTYVGTFDDRPYIAPFHGNIIELCPVGALTSDAYRFRARPWEIEDAGSVCTLCPAQCNVKFTVRDERVQRVLARDNTGVDDGWLCDKGRFGYQMISSPQRITEPLVGGQPATWEEALDAAAAGLRAAGERAAAIVGGQASNEDGYLVQRILRHALGSPHVGSSSADGLPRHDLIALSDPGLAGGVADLDAAKSILVLGCDPLHAMPILDLRIRKAARRSGTRVAIATDRPTALDGVAEETARYLPGAGRPFLAALGAELGAEGYVRAQGEQAVDAERIAGTARPGSTVIVYGTGLAGRELIACAGAGGARLIEVPAATNARGLREVGCAAVAGPGLSEVAEGSDMVTVREALAGRGLEAIVLVEADPVRDSPGGPEWDAALSKARFVLSVSMFENGSTRHADVVFPGEAYAEKEGTVTHPDGRLQRLRPGVPHPGDVRPMWQVLVELATRLDHETGLDSAPEVLEAIAADVPFYAGLTPEEIGGLGVRWQERDAARAFPGEAGPPERPSGPAEAPGARPHANGELRLGTYRDLWAAEVTEKSPALRFLAPKQTLELAPADAERLGIAPGDAVEIRSNGASVRAEAAVRERIRPGAAFLIEGTAEENANALPGAEAVQVSKVGRGE
jgi:NADH-quinone oxidoreductase subunit G